MLLGRLVRLRANRIVPRDFQARFLVRLQDGKLDRGKRTRLLRTEPEPRGARRAGVWSAAGIGR